MCSYETQGWLERRTVTRLLPQYVGKEGQPFEEDPESLDDDWERQHVVATDDRLWDLARVVLGDLPREQVARELGVSARTVTEWVAGRARPDDMIAAIRYAVEVASERLRDSLDHGTTADRILTTYQGWRSGVMDTLGAILGDMTVSAINRTFAVKARDAKRLQRGEIRVRLDTALRMLAKIGA